MFEFNLLRTNYIALGTPEKFNIIRIYCIVDLVSVAFVMEHPVTQRKQKQMRKSSHFFCVCDVLFEKIKRNEKIFLPSKDNIGRKKNNKMHIILI